ncbi:hypothetical protein EXIGLDRAFT_208520 [Exidia glandulosa HHB12029]|uniref:UBX domain-containing protein n=1 Tax=Exidia glandulosa HHB12029 TaxID=1314781 RepID=A0A165EL46_EXIGL|nr:hypothetical protein EXIGLDRAFT_208520 [Exidia glandulosa HHB12029]
MDSAPTPAPAQVPATASDDKGKQKELPAPDATPVAASATEHAFKVYNPPVGPSTALRDLPSDDLVPTAAEVQAAFQAAVRRSDALNNAPLRTKAMRDAEQKTKLDRWPNTTIRIRFPDRTQLEKSFPSTDRIKAVYVFVRDSLADEVKPIKFVLYQSPPKRELKNSDPEVRDLSLAQLQLAPSSVLLLRFEDERLNATTLRAPLRPDILALAEDLPAPPSYDATAASSDKGVKLGSSLSASGEKKIPKWLKLPGKK